MVKLSDFQSKEVINILDGKRIGIINDFELDLDKGFIKSIIVPSGGRILSIFSDKHNIVIPWKSIVIIGADVILVELKNYQKSEEKTLKIDQDTSRPHYRYTR